MFRPAKMEQVSVLIFDKDVDAVSERLVEIGLMHLVRIGEFYDWAKDLDSVRIDGQLSEHEELERKLDYLMKKLGVSSSDVLKEAPKAKLMGIGEERSLVSEIESEVSKVFVEYEGVKEHIHKLEDMFKQVKTLEPVAFLDTSSKFSFLEMAVGKLNIKNIGIIERGLARVPNVILPFRTEGEECLVLVMVLKKDKALLEAALRDAFFQRMEIPEEAKGVTKDVIEKLGLRIDDEREKLKRIERKIADEKKRYGETLVNLAGSIRVGKLIAKTRGYFKKTSRTFLVTGWVPQKEGDRLVEAIRSATEGRCVVERVPAEKMSREERERVGIPVEYENPALLKPFELLVSGYGTPSYGAIDPTFFFAVTFLVMFGVMFGDVGDGFVLALCGFFMKRAKRAKETVKKVGSLFLWCGISATIFGFLYGSVFGVESWLPAIWVSPMDNIMYMVKVALFFGIFVISMGIIINLINSFHSGDLMKGIFDKAGLLGGLIYWGCVGLILKTFVTEGFRASPLLVGIIVGVPLLLFFLRAPAAKLLGKRKKMFPEGAATYFMEMFVEIIEIFVGYLANTVSFIRVAAFALAHAGLFLAVFSLVDTVRTSPGGGFWAFLILVIGNIIILVLEGLIVTIQGIRLEYYEFFGKFFGKEGRKYEPIGLKEEN